MAPHNLHLRPLTLEDAASLAGIANDSAIAAFLRDAFPHPYTLENARHFIQKSTQTNPICVFGIFWEEKHVGNIGLYPGEDVYRKAAEIGYFIGKKYWGMGLASEAVRQVCDWGFTNLPIGRIFAGVFSNNPASGRVLEKNGFVCEGIARKAVFKNGEFLDEVRWGRISS